MYFELCWYSHFVFEIFETSDFCDLQKYMYVQQLHFLKSCANLSWLARIVLNEILSCDTRILKGSRDRTCLLRGLMKPFPIYSREKISRRSAAKLLGMLQWAK